MIFVALDSYHTRFAIFKLLVSSGPVGGNKTYGSRGSLSPVRVTEERVEVYASHAPKEMRYEARSLSAPSLPMGSISLVAGPALCDIVEAKLRFLAAIWSSS